MAQGKWNVRFQDNSAIVLRQIGTNSQRAMQNAGERLVESVQEKMLYGYKDLHGNPPHTEIVDTGALFDSIEAIVKRDSQNAFSVSVGTDIPYAGYVHNGTSKLKGRPFITDGAMAVQEELKEILATDLSAGFTKNK